MFDVVLRDIMKNREIISVITNVATRAQQDNPYKYDQVFASADKNRLGAKSFDGHGSNL